MRDDRYRLALVLITLLVAASSACWALLTPAFRAPDEAKHLNSTLRLAHGGGWPEPGDALVSPGVDQAWDEAAVDYDAPGRWWDRPEWGQYVAVVPPADSGRTVIGPGNGLIAPVPPGVDTSAWEAAEVDQMTQHPPLYYAVAANWMHLTGTAVARWDQQILALRLLDALLLLPVPALAAGAARLATGSRSIGLVAASFPLFVPQLGHIMGSITNDSLVVLTGAAAAYLCARVVTGDLRWVTAVALGVVVGLGLFTKVMAAFTVPVVVLAYLLARPQGSIGMSASARWRWRRLGQAACVLGLAFAVGGWWWLRNLIEYGAVQPVGMPERFEPVEDRSLWRFAGAVLQSLTWTFFGNFGFYEVRLPKFAFWTAAAVVAVLCLVAFFRRGSRPALLVLVMQPALLWCAVVANAWATYNETGWVVAVQGRYMFGGIVGFAAGVAAGVWFLVTWLARDRRSDDFRLEATASAWVLPAVVAAGATAAGSALLMGLGGFYRGPGEPLGVALERWAGWSPLTGAQLAVVLLGLAGLAVATVVACIRYARSVAATATAAPATARTPAPAARITGSE
ncbi:DUF2142 domain-containing protein [Myceligenerans crystallogenes]|uniref:Dolichyl-phosphate-mannose-protein mannosyltransferase n=1 Tax=Myceligenerans crystallogenes TaxID=316335 RepID=A0ABN2NBE5_9MICO